MLLKVIARYGFMVNRSIVQKERLKNKSIQYDPYRVIHKSYWNEMIQYCDKNALKTIKDILNPKLSKVQLSSLNQNILSLIDFNKKQQLKSYDLAVMAIALKKSNHNQIRMLKSRALDLFLHYAEDQATFRDSLISPKQQTPSLQFTPHEQLSSKTAEILIISICHQFINQWKNEKDKNRKNKYKLRLLIMLKTMNSYINSLSGFSYLFFLLSELGVDANMYNKFRISNILNIIEQRFRKILIDRPEVAKNINRYYHSGQELGIATFKYIVKCLQLAQYDTTEAQKFYINIICAQDFYPPDTSIENRIKSNLMLYKNLSLYYDENNKNPMLQSIKRLYYTNQQFKSCFQNYKTIFKLFYLINIIKSKFYNHYLQIPTTIMEGFLIITSLPPKPIFDEFELKLIHMVKQHIFEEENTLIEVLIAIYPEIFEKEKIAPIKKKNSESEKYNIIRGNEYGFRIGQAIKNLGVPYYKQVKVIGKKVDFLLQNNIIIECDGDIHIDYKRINAGLSTAWRNMGILYGGYRLISIGINQINQNRNANYLNDLITKKMSIMNNHKALLVQ